MKRIDSGSVENFVTADDFKAEPIDLDIDKEGELEVTLEGRMARGRPATYHEPAEYNEITHFRVNALTTQGVVVNIVDLLTDDALYNLTGVLLDHIEELGDDR